jgi:hypothetical protein
LKKIRSRKWEWFTLGTIIPIALILTFSGFKLPHYLNIIFPAASVLTAGWILQLVQQGSSIKPYAITQVAICSLLLLAVGLLNAWAFPVRELWIIIGFLMLVLVTYLLLKNTAGGWPRIIAGSVLTSVLVWFLMNAGFYPKLLTYQAGNELAQKVAIGTGGTDVYQQPGLRAFSFDFYTRTLAKPLTDKAFEARRPVWLLADAAGLKEARVKYAIGRTVRHRDYSVTQLTGTFINPATRQKSLSELVLAEVLGPKKY